MNICKPFRILLRSLGLSIALASLAAAQFPGDFYFTDPNPAVVEGQSTTLTVEVFTGSDAFGAASLYIIYDSVELRVDAVRPAATNSVESTVYSTDFIPLGRAIAVFNDESLTSPIGGIQLVEVDVTPLVAAGQLAQVTVLPYEMLQPDGSSFPSVNGFTSLITVVPDASRLTSVASPHVQIRPAPLAPWIDPLRGDVPYRRPGHPVDLWLEHFNPGRGRYWQRTHILTFDPGAPREGVLTTSSSSLEGQNSRR